MKRSLGRNWGRAAWAFACLLGTDGWVMAQPPEQQHWQATPNYPSNNPPNYQPSTTPADPTATGNPAVGAPAAAQYQSPQQPDQPIGPPRYPTIEPRQSVPAGQPPYSNQPPDNQRAYPQDPRSQGATGQGPPFAGQPPAGQPIQGPPMRSARPQAPFVLSPQEAAALENLLADWEKRDHEIHDMVSDFYRWKYDAVFNNGGQPPVPDEGTLKFTAPDKGQMKIEAKDPAQSEQWLCDGKSIYQFDYSRKLVTEFVMPPELQGKGIGDGPLPFVFGVEAQKLKQRYFMRIITPRDVQDQVWLQAYPRDQKQAAEFSKVEVILQLSGPKKVLSPFAIQMYSPNGKDRTVYQLHDAKINPRKGILEYFPGQDPWKPSIPSGWKTKTELPPPPIEIGLKPSISPRQ